MFNYLLKEIKECMDNGLYLASLMLSLSIPDICGKAIYKEIKNPGKRYIKWYDEWIYRNEENDVDPCINGEIIYLFRCNMYHEGKAGLNVDKISNENNRIEKFRLIIDKKDDIYNKVLFSPNVYIDFSNNSVSKETGYRIDAKRLSWDLYVNGFDCYEKNKDLFDTDTNTVMYVEKFLKPFV